MKILLVDDDALITDSFETILSSKSGFDVVGKATDGEQAVAFVAKHAVDLVLMDIRMPNMDGIEATAILKKRYPDLKVIVLTTFRDFRHVHQALHSGADGYMLKTDSVEAQLETIKTVMNGFSTFSREALEAYTARSVETSLTERENECMALIANGYNNKEIAKRMYIGEGTVRNLISNILDKLMLRDRTQIAIYYWQSRNED